MGGQGLMAGNWLAHRGNGGGVSLIVTPDVTAEAEHIRAQAEIFRSGGTCYSDQVLLARTHLTLSRLTTMLEKLNVPLLYLGDLFERDEIRDLLSLLALDAEPGNIGLPRIAALSPYKVAKDDALIAIAWAEKNGVTIFAALKRGAEIEGLSDNGRKGLVKLGAELDGLEQASPWTLLTTWLFERSDYLLPLLQSEKAKARQNLIAIYHFLKVCGESAQAGRTGRREFLARIRRIETLNQDTPFRAVSSEASDLDAIRVMTIHGSKGLEFGAVHFPALATGYMPKGAGGGGTQCPVPPTLSRLVLDKQDLAAEEEGLFFVGLSRARDHLSLSRADRYAAKNRAGPSKFLDHIGNYAMQGQFAGSGTSFVAEPIFKPRDGLPVYLERHLSIYLECPARFEYEVLDKMRGARDDSPYVQFHRCVYVTVDWLEKERMTGRKPTISEGIARLASHWSERGPVGHGFEAYYRAVAENMIASMCDAILTETGEYARAEWQIPLSNGVVTITPDRVLIEPSGLVRVQRTRTGKQTKSEPNKAIYALLRRGASQYHPGKPVSIETFYLATGEFVPVPGDKDDKKIKDYEEAIDGIVKGDFNIPGTLPRFCPNCPAYFACGKKQ